MKSHFQCAVVEYLLVIGILALPNSVLSEETGNNLNLPREPYSSQGLLSQRIAELNGESILVKWSRLNYSAEGSEHPDKIVETKERDVVVRLLRLSSEEIQKLDQAFVQRKKEQDKNTLPLDKLVTQEQMGQYALVNGDSTNVDTSDVMKSTPKDIAELIKQRSKAEIASERKLVEFLNEEFDPEQRRTLFVRWISERELYTPFSQSYLKLSDEQVDAIRLASQNFIKTQWKFERDYRAARKKNPGKPVEYDEAQTILRKPEWHDARLSIAMHLTPEQYRECLHLFFPDPKNRKLTFKEFLERVETRAQVQDEYNFIAQIELEKLGPIYREGARLEKEAQEKRQTTR